MNSVQLAKQTKIALRKLKRKYRDALKCQKDVYDEWLCDNYYLIDRRASGAVEALVCERVELDEIYSICYDQTAYKSPDFYGMLSDRERLFSTASLELFAPVAVSCLVLHAGEDRTKIPLCVKGLRQLDNVDFESIIEDFSVVGRQFMRDGTYRKMDNATKRYYIGLCQKQAKRQGISEECAAHDIVQKATAQNCHIGHFFDEETRRKYKLRQKGRAFLWLRLIVPAVTSVVTALLLDNVLWSLLLFVPFHEILRTLLEWMFMKGTKPYFIPKMKLENGVPKEAATLVTVSSLVPQVSRVDDVCAHLEELYYANSKGEVKFCLLCDFAEAKVSTLPSDSVEIDAIKRGIEKLNRKHGNKFYLLIRPRVYSKTQNMFSGYERKRGALCQLCDLIKTGKNAFSVSVGSLDDIRQIKYIYALDADTKLPLDGVVEMASAALHPLNKARVENGSVKDGYGLFVPMLNNTLQGKTRTFFSSVMCGKGGNSAYNSPCSNLYQDLLGLTVFSGKGFIDVDTFMQTARNSFEDGVVLSHDILEGGILRSAFCSFTSVSESSPDSADGWQKRHERWVRGDFQNIPFIFSKHFENNPETRFFLIDNIIRQSSWVFCAVMLIVSAFIPSVRCVFLPLSLLGVTVGNILSAVRLVFLQISAVVTRRYRSGLIRDALSDLLRAGMSVMMLINYGTATLSAGARALYRRFVSGKNLLSWTTAHDADQLSKGGLLSYVASGYLGVCTGFIFFAFFGSVYRMLGLFFMLCPVILCFGSKRMTEKQHLTDGESKKAVQDVMSMWKFYDECCNQKNNYLPPDNIQFAPAYREATRTSPTNIGMMLLSAYCVYSLGIISAECFLERVEKCLDSLDKLERYRGHFLNWYDTETLKPLYPRYCSTVDSGNLICCLEALKNASEKFVGERWKQIQKRIETIINSADFGIFYDKKKKLLAIGYDIEKNELTDCYYDLLMSEARTTVYYAVSKGQIPKEAWSNLSRTLTGERGRFGPVSWTGTAFEYLMPPILLPTYKGSLCDEAVKYSIFCQKNSASKRGLPFGCSESGFYAFDNNLNYQYKAHGIQRLGLKRSLDSEYVVSPYSSYLALPFDKQSAFANLKRLEKLGCVGKYGLYEAVDFTPVRCANLPYAVVRSYMAHHVGMSICATYNALSDFELVKQFMKNEMQASKELLKEKIPTKERIYSHLIEKREEKRPTRPVTAGQTRENISLSNPCGYVLSNGLMTCLAFDNGMTKNFCAKDLLYVSGGDIHTAPKGVFAVITDRSKRFSITALLASKDVNYRVKNQTGAINYYAETDRVGAKMSVSLDNSLPCEIRKISLKNLTMKRIALRLLLYLEPCLVSENDFLAHPAFCRLFNTSGIDEQENIIYFLRRDKNDINRQRVMGVAFDRDVKICYETRREQVLKRVKGVKSLLSPVKLSNNAVGTPDPCLAVRISFRIPPKKSRQTGMYIAWGESVDEVKNTLCTVRSKGGVNDKNQISPFSMGSLDEKLVSRLLPKIINPQLDISKMQKNFTKGDLWSLGISGDYPIVCAKVDSADDLPITAPLIRLYSMLRSLGIRWDLCILYEQGGDYYGRLKTAIEHLVKEKNSDSFLGNGIYVIDTTRVSKASVDAVQTVKCCDLKQLLDSEKGENSCRFREILSVDRATENDNKSPVLSTVAGDFFESSFAVKPSPELPYSNVMANEIFGTVVTDRSLGFSYYLNSGENRLTPFANDTRNERAGEMILLKTNGKIYDLIDGAKAEFSKNHSVYKGVAEGVSYTVAVSVKSNAKVISFECDGDLPKDSKIAYYCRPIISQRPKNTNAVFSQREENFVFLQNAFCDYAPTVMTLWCDKDFFEVNNSEAFFDGKWDSTKKGDCVAVITSPKNSVTFCLTGASDIAKACEQIDRAISSSNENDKEKENTIIIDTPSEPLNVLFNTWLPIQFENSRYLARCGFYQSAGGYGFRDQLQDICAIMLLSPKTAREHIVRCCKAQFPEGDVLHWWHQTDKGMSGVRTRCSDDMLWLVYALFEYLEKTHDYEILREQVPFILGESLSGGEQERYFIPRVSEYTATVYEHALLAANRVSFAQNGLLKIGSCDWNDGFSRVGNNGEGSSVWLTQFYSIVASRMAVICEKMNDTQNRDKFLLLSQKMKNIVDEVAYDGEWYTRAYFDNGDVMGSQKSKEGKIDLLPQAFASLCEMPDKARVNTALDKALDTLVDRQNGIIRLFAPHYHSVDAGYISSYPAGVRENGGQYTHGAVWLAKALLVEGRNDEGYELLRYINPIERYGNPEWQSAYKTEPYAIAADIYCGGKYTGRGGWTHYTGAAAWYYRTVLEDLLGIKIYGDRVEVTKKVVADWRSYTVRLRVKNTNVTITVQNSSKIMKTPYVIPLDGKNHTAVL